MIETILGFVKSQLANQFATGGLLMVAFGAVLAALRSVPGKLWALMWRYGVTTVDISDNDEAFSWLTAWFAQHEYTRDRARLLTVSTRSPDDNDGSRPQEVSAKRKPPEVIFSPAPGRHFIRYNGRWVIIDRSRRELDSTMVHGGAAHKETFCFYALSRGVIRDIILAARDHARPDNDNTIAILRGLGWNWKLVQRRPPRALDSVVLAAGVVEDLISDVRAFVGSKEWYARHGIPYQRSYMLHGPPGNGKSSLVCAIASVFYRDIYILSLASATDETFASLMTEVPSDGIVLLEDIDRAFQKREKTSDTNKTLTFSGFINAIDGVASPQGRLLFMTTNHPEQLDAALKRPGRVDRMFELGNATQEQAKRLFLRYFPDSQLADMFAQDKADGKTSMAMLQEHLINNRDNSAEAAANDLAKREGEAA